MDNTEDRIYFKDRQSRFLLINRSTAAFFRLEDPTRVVGKTDSDFFSEKHARQAYADEQKIIASGESLIGIEEKETWPDGHETWVSSSKMPFRDRDGRIIGIFGISRDITGNKLGEEARIRAAALREANVELEKINASLQTEIGERERVEELLAHERDLFRAMMDNTTDRIYFKDQDSRFQLINQSLASHFGISDPAEAIGKRDFDFFSEEHARDAYNDEKKLVASEKPFIGKEEKETFPDGHATWVSTTKFAMRDLEGKIIGTFGISRDITERKAIENSILQANEELEKTNQALQSEIAERLQTAADLARERNLFRTMMDSTSDHIYFKDLESCFLLVNRSLATQFKLGDSSEATGKTDFDYFTEEHARQAFQNEKQIIADGKPLIGIEEKETWPDGHETWISSSKFPMRDQDGRIIGTFGISREITERKAMELSIELANEKLAEMVTWLEGRNRDFSVLYDLGKMLEACRSVEDAFPVVSSQMEKLISVQTGKLYLLDETRHCLETVARWGSEPGAEESFSPQECRAFQSRSTIILHPTPSETPCRHLSVEEGEISVCLCIPLISLGEELGILHLRGRRGEGLKALPDPKLQLAGMAADYISLSLANLRLRETLRVQSIRDPLTGLFNRRYLEDSLIQELARTKRRGTTLGVIMVDVDRLKEVNDTLGHEAGDLLLKTVSRWLQNNIRTGDISCRYGGDEFVIIFPDASLEIVSRRAGQICEGIRGLRIYHKGEPLSAATVSIGVAGYPTHGETRDALMAAADAALYSAKQQGRDRAIVAGG